VTGGRYAEAVEVFFADASHGWGASLASARAAALGAAATVDGSGEPALPPPEQVFRAFRLTPLSAVRVVILGQDPYPTPGHAEGLAFSHGGPPPLPRSLANIGKELSADAGAPPLAGGSLAGWARQGVLLLNACLTVPAGRAGGHRGLGWEAVTDAAIAAVSARTAPSVFILWGADAQAKRPIIDGSRHLVIGSAHPSPLSARQGFFGSRPFTRANAFLAHHGRGAIDWHVAGR
jgi:uracil-DNA glycosylase